MNRFARTDTGRAFDVGLKESADRLHKLFPQLDPAVFTAYLTLGRTWTALSRTGEKYSASMGLTAYQRHSLRFLLTAQGERLTIGDLAALLETSSANTTKLVNRMQRSGLVTRQVDEGDRRVVWVTLTPAGRQRYLAALPISELDRQAFAVLSQEELECLEDFLVRIQERVESLNGNSLAHSEEPSASDKAARPGQRSKIQEAQ